MKGDKQTKEQLLNELAELRRYIAELEKSENKGKRAKKAQLSSENFYKTLFENIITAAAILGEDDTILLANKEFEQLTGYAREEVEGKKKWTEFVARKDELKQMKEYSRLRLIKPLSAPQKYEFQLVDRKGQVKDILTTIAKMPGKKQTLTTLLDITEHKRMEAALEKRIVALTRPLDNIKNIVFEDLFNLPDLQRLQDNLAYSWGVAILLTHPDGTAITSPSNFTNFCQFIRGTEKGFQNCRKSDAELGRYNPCGPIIHKCLSAGLWGAGASITAGGCHIANWLIGQVRNEAQNEEEILEYARELGIDETVFSEAFLQVPVMSQKKFEQIACTLFALANQLSGIAYQNIQQARFIVERKQAEEALQESEKRVRRKLDAILSPEGDIGTLELSDIIDTEKIQKLMDEFFDLTNLPMTITDLNGKVLVGIGWQDICTNFHRVNPESCRLCIESDLELTSNVQVGTFKKYRCKNNMWDIATPIMLGDKCVGNIFMGQFLFDNEKPDYETFRQQARKYGFDEQGYIAALDRVPRWSEKTINKAMSFFSIFAEIIGNLGYSNIKLANAVEERKRAEEALRKSEEKFRGIYEESPLGIELYDQDGTLLDVNKACLDIFGISDAKAVIGVKLFENPNLSERLKGQLRRGESVRCEIPYDFGKVTAFNLYETTKRGIIYLDVLITPLRGGTKEFNIGYLVHTRDITDRKQAERALRDSEEVLRSVFKTTPVGLCIMKDRVFQSVNKAWLNICGYSESDLIGHTPRMLYENEEEYERVGRELFTNLAKRGLTSVQTTHRRKDGSFRDVMLAAAPLLQENSSLGAVVTVEDITERKKAEYALRESEKKYRRLHESMTEAFVIVDMKGRIQESNHAYQSMLGYSEEELCHLTYSDITPEKWHALEKSIIEDQILLQGRAPIYEKEYQRKDGSVFPVELSTFLIRDEAGNPVRMWAIVHDITERKHAEAVLKESEGKYNQFFKTSRDCVFITKDGSLVDVNDAAVELLGYSSREELLQVKVPDLYAEPEAEAKHFRIIAEYGYGKEYPVDFRRKDGSIRHTLVTSAARYDANGDLIGFQGTVRDVTEQRQNEEELRKYREKLEVLVAERTRELEDKTKNLEEVNTALNVLLKKRENDRKLLEENFVANIGSLVLPYLEKIRKNNLDAQQKFFLDTVEKNLDEIGSPLLKNIHQFNLTPREIQIAYLIKDGKTTKEIATVLGIVEGSISTHRKNIRKKLGLDRTSNLQSQLRFFEK